MRAMERGHVALARRRTGGEVPGCGGRTPRALALGQAAPAFAVLAAATVLSLCMLAGEVAYHRYFILKGPFVSFWTDAVSLYYSTCRILQ